MLRATAVVLVLLLLAIVGFVVMDFHQHGQFDENGARIWMLAQLIEATEPSDGERETLERVITADFTNLPPEYWLNDAWGNPFLVRVWRAPEFHYEVISYGRDGKAGPCRVGPNDCDHPRADWVIRDGELRQ